MLRMLEAQAPAKQTATDTINTLSSRLSSATLLEDRRAAILGLRSFAKQFPASVASGALRDLLAALQKDGDDFDTIKVVLETLLMLFEPDEQSPEASEEITLWLADEFSMRQDNITALLDLLETGDFYLRLYTLQILAHVCTARPERTYESVLAAPLGVSRITAVLDERREAVRNEALLLLVALTPASGELQKVVAFENAFDRVLTLIESEGGLTHGSTTVQDCLSLLANLLNLNTSNQAYFREIGCIARVSKLLADALKEEASPDGVSDWIKSQRDMNLWGLLGVIQLFLVRGSQATPLSQTAFWQNRVLLSILQIAFHPSFGNNVRAKCLDTCGGLIRGNAALQEQFGDLFVPLFRKSDAENLANGHTATQSNRASAHNSGTNTPAPTESTNVIEALLSLALEPASIAIFDIRLAACDCVKSFLEGHDGIRAHVLRRAIEGHKSGEDSIPNILTVLLEPVNMRSSSDPYQAWMAGVLLLHLLYENEETKAMALQVSEGNADEGEEVVTFVQSLTSNIVAGVQHVEGERALLGYLMLLCIWLFEDPEAVNDLLGEGSNVQGLVAAIKVARISIPLVAGLCSFLIGIIYEFSTKDSPIPRSTLHSILMKSLTRELYVDCLIKLRESSFVRDFEVLSAAGHGGLPNVFFDKTFMDFLKDNFSRVLRAIDRDPSFEASIVFNGVQKGVSRELVDSLRAEVEEQKRSLGAAQSGLLQLRQKFEQEELEHRRTRDSTAVELGRIKQINESLQRSHGEETSNLERQVEQQRVTHSREKEQLVAQMQREHETTLAEMRRSHQTAVDESSQKHQAEKRYLEQRQSGHERELARLKETMSSQHNSEVEKLVTQFRKDNAQLSYEIEELKQGASQAQEESERYITSMKVALEEAQDQLSAIKESLSEQIDNVNREHASKSKSYEDRLEDANVRVAAAEAQNKELRKRANTAEVKLQETEEQLSAAKSKLSKLTDELKASQDKIKKLEQDFKKTESKTKDSNGKNDAKASKEIELKNQKLNQEIERLEKQISELRPAAEKAKEIQTELDDLLVVFADLEAKRSEDKKRLKELGEEVSEDEDGEDAGDDDGEDEDEDDEEEAQSDID